jgi:hypothetical protein
VDSAVEDAEIALIKRYYLAITEGNLESAYNMYGVKRPSWTDYQEWYKTAMSAVPVGFEKTKENNYRFEVAYSDSQSGEARYLVVMEVAGGKINPISSVKVSDN